MTCDICRDTPDLRLVVHPARDSEVQCACCRTVFRLAETRDRYEVKP